MRRNAMSARARGSIQRRPPTDPHLPATAMKCEGERVPPVPDKASAEDANDHASVLSDQRTPELVPSHFIGPVITETEYLEDIGGVPASERPGISSISRTSATPGMLLVSPRIFKEFAKRFGEDGCAHPSFCRKLCCRESWQLTRQPPMRHVASWVGFNRGWQMARVVCPSA